MNNIAPTDVFINNDDRDSFSRHVLLHIENLMSISHLLPTYKDVKVINYINVIIILTILFLFYSN